MKRRIFFGLSAAVVIIILIILIAVSLMPVKNVSSSEKESAAQSADKVEVYLFHATRRCTTCIAIGKLAGETVEEYFQPEIRDGRIEFKEINIDLPENQELANKFQAGGSALFINTIRGGQDNISEDTTVWRLTTDEKRFKDYLRGRLNLLLGK